jgi:hypothetical protein
LEADWNGHEAPKPDPRAIDSAQKAIGLLPDDFVSGKLGVDGEGHIYFRLERGHDEALLTIEPDVLHLRYKSPGNENQYVDDERFDGARLPEGILSLLQGKAVERI